METLKEIVASMRREMMRARVVLAALAIVSILLFFVLRFWSSTPFGIPFPWFLSLLLPLLLLLRFTLVKEGTAKIVMQFGSFHRVLLAKEGYVINSDGDIAEGVRRGLPGGLRFVGIRGIHTIHRRDLKWVKSLPDGKLENRFDENVDFILAKVDYQYGLNIIKAESEDLLGLNALMTLTASVVNPYKAQFAVKDWFGAVVNRIAPYIREYISNNTYEDLINDPDVQLDRAVWEKLNEQRINADGGSQSIIGELKERYGIEIHALETVDINPEEEYRKATLAKWQASRDAEKRLGSTTGTLMKMIADQTGLPLESIQAEFGANPDMALRRYEGLIKMNKDFIEQQIASDAGSLRRYYFQGGTGGMDLIALLGDVFHGGGKGDGGSTSAGGKGDSGSASTGNSASNSSEKYTTEDMEKALEEMERQSKEGKK